MNHPLIKICGITNPTDAMAAIQAGADWLGFIFVPDTPRFITMETAQRIIEKIRSNNPKTQMVGVFQNQDHHDIQNHIHTLNLNQVQLHGNESPEFCAQISVPVIKTILLQPKLNPATLTTQATAYLQTSTVKTVLLDLPKGSALKSVLDVAPSVILQSFLSRFPCFLAGGLQPQNIQQVLTQFQPSGVDVASGVEQAPGQKDLETLKRFCEIVHNFKSQPNRGDFPLCNP